MKILNRSDCIVNPCHFAFNMNWKQSMVWIWEEKKYFSFCFLCCFWNLYSFFSNSKHSRLCCLSTSHPPLHLSKSAHLAALKEELLGCRLFRTCRTTCSCSINTPCSDLSNDKNVNVELGQRATIHPDSLQTTPSSL